MIYPVVAEELELRDLPSSTFPNSDISRMTGSQAEGAIAVDHTRPSHLVAVSNVDLGSGLIVTTSNDGGVTWTPRKIATGTDGLPPACCDPSLAFDSDGNLYLAYLNGQTNAVIVLLSVDDGQSFSLFQHFNGNVDQPTITAGAGSVWVTFASGNGIVATGASEGGLGQVAAFPPPRTLPGSSGGNFGDVAIGANGEVVVTYQKQINANRSQIFVNVDQNGISRPVFSKARLATTTNVGAFDYIDAQPNRGIDAEAGLAIDGSGGPFTGRLYLVYTDESPAGSGNTDIFVRYSDTAGVAWSSPIRVNDDTTLNSQFLPRIALDQTSGNIAVGWYDARNDQGQGNPWDLDNLPNDDVAYFATILRPLTDGLNVAANQQISDGVSSANDANNQIDLGDYTGLTFDAGIAHPLWFDNSNSTGDNPNGAMEGLNVYTSSVAEVDFPSNFTNSLSGLPQSSGPDAMVVNGKQALPFVTRGASYTIVVRYTSSGGLTRSSVGSGNLLITGPNGFSNSAVFVRSRLSSRTTLQATYLVTNPNGNWTTADSGVYSIYLQPDQILDTRGRPSDGGVIGGFVVDAGAAGKSHQGAPGPRHAQHVDNH